MDYSFQEFGISLEKHVGNSVTDAGPEVRCCCDVLLPNLWARCTPHMISTAFAKAFDSIDRPGDQVPMDRGKELLKKVRKTVEFFHKSPNGANLLSEILAATIEDHGLSPISKSA